MATSSPNTTADIKEASAIVLWFDGADRLLQYAEPRATQQPHLTEPLDEQRTYDCYFATVILK